MIWKTEKDITKFVDMITFGNTQRFSIFLLHDLYSIVNEFYHEMLCIVSYKINIYGEL